MSLLGPFLVLSEGAEPLHCPRKHSKLYQGATVRRATLCYAARALVTSKWRILDNRSSMGTESGQWVPCGFRHIVAFISKCLGRETSRASHSNSADPGTWARTLHACQALDISTQAKEAIQNKAEQCPHHAAARRAWLTCAFPGGGVTPMPPLGQQEPMVSANPAIASPLPAKRPLKK
eukprot:2471611-Amphidinium_carterae.2